jgi:CHU_C Type IX secretion signal domain
MIKTLLTWLLLLPTLSWGQIAIGGGTQKIASSPGTTIVTSGSVINSSTAEIDLSNTTLILASSTATAKDLITVKDISLQGLIINSRAPYSVQGSWTVTNNLAFTNGLLNVGNSANNKLTYKGTADLEGNDLSYVSGKLYVQGQAYRTFAIGNSDGYFPAALTNLSESDKEVSMEVITGSSVFTVTAPIKEILTTHFWQLTSASPLKSETQISLSNNKADFTTTGGTVILEKNATTQNDLGGTIDLNFFTSANNISSTGRIYGLAKSDKVSVIIHKLITPDNDTKNDGLFIENIELFPDNEVTLIDRYGVPFKTWKNFTNVNAEGTDFTKLANGNYICIVKYNEFGKEVSLKPQMISVLK